MEALAARRGASAVASAGRGARRPGPCPSTGALRPGAGGAPAVASRLRAAPRRGGEAREEGPAGRRRVAHPAAEGEAGRSGAQGRATAGRWRPPTPGATTTCGGWTGWSRSNRPLVERMALVWHDWFATSNDGVGAQRLMLHQNELFRKHGLGSFTRPAGSRHARSGDAAVAVGLGEHEGVAQRELRARADGAVHARRRPRLHRGRRARAGARADRLPARLVGRRRAAQLPLRSGAARYWSQEGARDARAASTGGTRAGCACEHNSHPSFFVEKLWSYFIPVPPGKKTRLALQRLYMREGYKVRPVLEAILKHPSFYRGPRMVKPPVVYLGGNAARHAARRRHRGLGWLSEIDEPAALLSRRTSPAGRTSAGSTPASWRGALAGRDRSAVREHELKTRRSRTSPTRPLMRCSARSTSGARPTSRRSTRAAARGLRASAATEARTATGGAGSYPVLRQNALRVLVATSPDLQAA